MIRHIVMWKLKDGAMGCTKTENALSMKNQLERLAGVIPELKYLQVGMNVAQGQGAYDIVLVSEFEDLEKLNVYQNHPEHLKIAEFIGKVREDRVVVDYEA